MTYQTLLMILLVWTATGLAIGVVFGQLVRFADETDPILRRLKK